MTQHCGLYKLKIAYTVYNCHETLHICILLIFTESSCKGDVQKAEGGLKIEPISINRKRDTSGGTATATEDKRTAKADTALVSVEPNKRPRQKTKKKMSSESSKVKLPMCGPPKQESAVQYIVVQPANPDKMYFTNVQTNRRVGDALHITPIKPTEPKPKARVPLQPQKKSSDPLKLEYLDSCIRRKKTFIIPPSLSPSNSSCNYQGKKKSRFDNYILQGIPVPTSTKGPLSTKPKGVGVDPTGATINIFRPRTKCSSRKEATTPLAYSRQQRPSVNLNGRLPRVNTPVNPSRRSSNGDNFLVNMLNNLG